MVVEGEANTVVEKPTLDELQWCMGHISPHWAPDTGQCESCIFAKADKSLYQRLSLGLRLLDNKFILTYEVEVEVETN